MKPRLLATFAAVALLPACASYTGVPLRAADAVLAPPDHAIISADAQTIDRPYLTPQAIDLAQPLTPNALAVLAVLVNPDLKALRLKTGVTDAQAFSARLLPDPSFQGNFDKVLSGPDPFNAFGAQIGFDLNQFRTRGITRASGAAVGRQVRLDLAWAEWNAAGQARLQGVRVLALTKQLVLAQAGDAAARTSFWVTQRAVGRGDLAAGELDARRLSLIDAEAKARTAETALATARGDLNKQLGLPPETVLRLAEPPAPPLPPPAATLVAQAMDRRLDLQALRAGYQVGEADLQVTVLNQFPNLSLTLAGARDTAKNYTAGPAIGFNLPLWNRNRGAIAVARATREQLRGEYEARLFQTRAEIAAGVLGVETQRRQRAALAEQMPALLRYAEATGRAARRGDLAPVTAATAEQAARDQRLALLQLDQQIAEQTIALELLSGGPSEGWTR